MKNWFNKIRNSKYGKMKIFLVVGFGLVLILWIIRVIKNVINKENNQTIQRNVYNSINWNNVRFEEIELRQIAENLYLVMKDHFSDTDLILSQLSSYKKEETLQEFINEDEYKAVFHYFGIKYYWMGAEYPKIWGTAMNLSQWIEREVNKTGKKVLKDLNYFGLF